MPVLTTQDRLGMTVAGKYRLERVLGEGGMGVVYAGHHLKLDLPVAVKFLHPQYSRSPEIVDRFLREARATSRLLHPNVVQVRDVDVADEDGSVYMVLELLAGKSLAKHLEEQKVLSVDETLTILLPVIDALAAAHDLGIVHRDIKPDNVFLCRASDGRVIPKVLDFGIAKLTEGGSSPSATATGAIMGTALYMAPEQAMGRGKEIGPPSDVWSTAVMAYECLTGTFPFDLDLSAEMNAMAVMLATVTAPIVPLVDRRSELGAMSAALGRALERTSTARTPTMRALAEDLRSAAAGVSAEVKRSRVLSARPPAGRITTGPLEDPTARPAPGAPQGLSAQQVTPGHGPITRAAADSFARTALPDSPVADSPGAGAPVSRTNAADTGAAISPTAMISAGLPADRARSATPYAIGALVALVLAIGAAVVAATGATPPTAVTASPDPTTGVSAPVSPPSTAVEPVVEPTTAVADGEDTPTVAHDDEGAGAETGAEGAHAAAGHVGGGHVGSPSGGREGGRRHGRDGAPRVEAPSGAASGTGGSTGAHVEVAGSAVGVAVPERGGASGSEPEGRGESDRRTDHRAGGLSAGEF